VTTIDNAQSAELAEAYIAGLQAGRREAAADIRAKAASMAGEQYRHFEMAARIAEREK
jgi:hypothetical protein